MPVIPYLTTSNTVPQMMGTVNNIISHFDNIDSAAEIKYSPFGTVTANNIQMAVQQVEVQANTKITAVNSALTANVATLNTSISSTESRALANAIALSIALG